VAKKRESTLVRQKQIVEAARKLIIKRGSEHLTVSRIAREAGISEGAIYRHFRSKKEILSFLLDHAASSLLGDMALQSAENHTTLEAISDVLEKHLKAIEKRHGSSFQVIAEVVSFGDKKLNGKAFDIINSYIGRLSDLLSAGARQGSVRADIDQQAVATLVFGMVQGLVNLWALSNYSFGLTERFVPLWRYFRRVLEKG
jgi:AcrR family transcriptional regulator